MFPHVFAASFDTELSLLCEEDTLLASLIKDCLENFSLDDMTVQEVHLAILRDLEVRQLYSSIEEEPERQEELFVKFYRADMVYLHKTIFNLTKLSNNLTLAVLIFSSINRIRYEGIFFTFFVNDSIIADIYRGRTAPNSRETFEERRDIAISILECALTSGAGDQDWKVRIFKEFLRIIDVAHIPRLCASLLEVIPRTVGIPLEELDLWTWCNAIVENPNMHVALIQHALFSITARDIYYNNGFFSDKELYEKMMGQIVMTLYDETLIVELQSMEFSKIVLAFRRFNSPSSCCSKKDRMDLRGLLTPLSLTDHVLEIHRRITPEGVEKILKKCPLGDALVKFLEYKWYNYMGLYLGIPETVERQLKLYKFFLSNGNSYHDNILHPMKFIENLILAGLIFLERNEKNSTLWGRYSAARELFLNTDGNQGDNLRYSGNFWDSSVDDRFLSVIYCARLDDQEIGKPIAMAMLRKALLCHNEGWQVFRKLYHFFQVADPTSQTELYEYGLSRP
jgi:hypothetical protein